METIHKVKVVDRTRIKDITFKNPELMNIDAFRLVKNEYYALIKAQNELYEARAKVRELEKKFKAMEDAWNAKKDMFDIEFESTEKEVKTEKSNMLLNGKLVYKYDY